MNYHFKLKIIVLLFSASLICYGVAITQMGVTPDANNTNSFDEITSISYDESYDDVGDNVENNEIAVDAAEDFKNHPDNHTYFENGTIGNVLSWTISQSDVVGITNYTIYVNTSIVVDEQPIPPGKTMEYNVDHLNVALYNITCEIKNEDLSFNHTAWVSIVASEPPQILGSANDLILEVGEIVPDLQWVVYDLSLENYTVYIDGISYFNGTITIDPVNPNNSTHEIVVSLDPFNETGTYNITSVFRDELNLSNSSMIEIEVVEAESPLLIEANTTSFVHYTSDNFTLSWEFSDLNPQNFTVYENGSSIIEGTWESDVPISITINGPFTISTYLNYTIIVEDNVNKTTVNTVLINFSDLERPVINSSPSNVTASYKSDGYSLVWNVFDQNSGTYSVFVNGSITVDSVVWNNGDINYLFSSNTHLPGVYNITISISDLYDNVVISTVWITILTLETQQVDVSQISSQVTTGQVDDLQFEWYTSSGDPIPEYTVIMQLTNEDFELDTINETATNTGLFEYQLDYSGVPSGTYDLQLSFSKPGYESFSTTVQIIVEKRTLELQVQMDNEFIQGQEFTITVQVVDPEISTNNIDLSQQSLGEIMIEVSIDYLLLNNQENNYFDSGLTNENGIFTTTLSSDLTENIQELISVQANIVDNEFISSQNISIGQNELPEVKIQGLFKKINLFARNNSFLSIILLLILLISISSISVYLYKKLGKHLWIENYKKEHAVEIEFIQNIDSLIGVLIRNLEGIPIYELEFKEIGSNSVLIAGLTSALSSFINEVSNQVNFSYEVVERDEFSLISHKEQFSVMSIISKKKIPKKIIEGLENAHRELDQLAIFSNELTNKRKEYWNIIIYLMSDHGLRVDLVAELEILPERFHLLAEKTHLSEKWMSDIKKIIEFCNDEVQDGKLYIPDIIEEMSTLGLNRERTATIISILSQFELLKVRNGTDLNQQ